MTMSFEFEESTHTEQTLCVTERVGGYILSECGVPAPARAMGGFLGLSFIVAGLGLLLLPVTDVLAAKGIVVLILFIMGGIFAARAGQMPQMELEVDLERQTLCKRRRVGSRKAHLIAQYSFDAVLGLDVEGDRGRATLYIETSTSRRAVLTGTPEDLQSAARRIGGDLLRYRHTAI